MRQLTLRGFGEDLEREIQRVADEQGISLNHAVLRLLRRGAGLDTTRSGPPQVGDVLDRHFGTWTEEEAEELREANRVFDAITKKVS